MAPTQNSICAFGWKAREFALKGIDGKAYSLSDVRGAKGTLVIFICNHCPYVKSSIGRIVQEAGALSEFGVGTIAIMPNDTATYREDSFDNMKAFAASHRSAAGPTSTIGNLNVLHRSATAAAQASAVSSVSFFL